MKLRVISLALGLLTLVAITPAQVVQKNGGYLIFIKFKKGQVLKQNLSMVAVGNSKLATNSQIVTKCLDVDKNGIATLQVSTPTAPGKPNSVRTVKIDRHGKPSGNTIDGFSGNFMWPDVPIKVGHAWKGDLNMNETGQGQGILKATYKLVGIKTINKVKVAVISAYMDVTGQYDVAGTGTINVRVSDGQLYDATFNMGLSQYNDGKAPTVLKLLMTLRNQS